MDAELRSRPRQSINIVKICARQTLPHRAHRLGIRRPLAVQMKPLRRALTPNLRHQRRKRRTEGTRSRDLNHEEFKSLQLV